MSDGNRNLKTIYAISISNDLAGRSVREVLLRYGRVSHSILRRAKREGGIRVNGEEVWVSSTLEPGDVVELKDPVRSDRAIDAEPVPLNIVYEDARLIVVDKPAGILVHPVKKNRSGTVANGLAWLYLSRGEISGIHPVHRLDRGTSGLVVLAKDALTHFELSKQLVSRSLTRTVPSARRRSRQRRVWSDRFASGGCAWQLHPEKSCVRCPIGAVSQDRFPRRRAHAQTHSSPPLA